MEDIQFKGTLNGIVIVMEEEDSFNTILNKIEKKLNQSGTFFKNATIAVKYRGKKLTNAQEQKLKEFMESKSQASIKSVIYAEDKPKENKKNKDLGKITKPKILKFNGLEEGLTKFHKGTLRSGQVVRSEGNLVVFGDVNPGAEVIANGHVVVLGSLRGTARAGYDGNYDAIIYALRLHPVQLSISNIVTRAPDDSDMIKKPEIASVKDGKMIIETMD